MGFESIYKLSVIMQMVDNLSQPLKGISNKMDSSLSTLDRMSQGFGTLTQTGAAMAGVGAQITEGVMKPIEATFDTKRAIGELASLGVQDLGLLEDAATQFSETWAGTTKPDFITAAYDIKSGIASLTDEGIAGYTEIAGVTATATKSTIGEMTDLFATGYGIYKNFYDGLSDIEFAEMFSAGIAESVKGFKTTGSGMAEAIKNLGASATTAQVPLEEQLSILGMLQATMSGSEAGTKYKAFLRSAVKGGEELGLSFLDANDNLLSMPEILEQLRGKFGETMDAAEKMELQKAFGDTEAVALIDLMYNKCGDLQSNILNLYDSMASGKGAATSMADAINQTDPSKYELLKQKVDNVKEAIGNSLNPVIGDYMDKAGALIGQAGEWVASHENVVRVVMQVMMVLGLVLLSVGTVTSVIGGLGMMFTRTAALATGFGRGIMSIPDHLDSIYIQALYAKDGLTQIGSSVANVAKRFAVGGVQAVKGFALHIATMGRQAITTAATAMPGLIASVWSFTAALLANPITWVVIGIVALIAGIILLWNKCEWFRDGVTALLNFLGSMVSGAVEVIGNILSGIGKIFGHVLDAAKATVSEKLSNMQQAYEQHGGGIRGAAAAAVEGVKGYFTAGYTFIDNLTGGKLSEIKNKIANSAVGQAFGHVLDAAKATVSEKLSNMQQAYEQHGGGIRGISAAAIEGVKGYYTAGLTFIDNLTGGKLTDIREKFSGKISEIKGIVSNAIGWFRESGKKIITTFTDGIQSVIDKPKEVVSKGLQGVRKLLPFSDAKEGPLSTLTLSGRKVLETFDAGIRQRENLPAESVNRSFEKIEFSAARPDPEFASREEKKDINSKGSITGSQSKKGTIIENLNLHIDLKKIKDLQKLLQLLEEIEDYTNGNGPDIEPEPQPV